MKGKKIVALLLVFFVLLTLAACSRNEGSSENSGEQNSESSSENLAQSSGEEITLTFMTCVSSTSDDPIKKLVEEYDAEGVTIDYQPIAGSTTDYQQKLTTLFAAGSYPDVLHIPTIWSRMHGDLGVAQVLDGLIDQEVLDDFNAAPLATCKYKDQLVGLPLSNDCITIFYNKGQIDSAGVEIPDSYEKAWTWDELETNAAKAKEANGTKYGVVFANEFSIELPFFWQSGATVLNPTLDGVTVNQQGTIDTLGWFRGLMDKDLCSANIFLGVDDAEAMFVSQYSPIYVANCGGTAHLLDMIEGNFELGATYLTRNKEHANKIGGWNMEVLNKTEHLDAALDFLQYIVSPEVMNTYCTSLGSMPTRKSAADTIEFGELDPYAPLFIEEIANIPEFALTDSVNVQYQTYKGLMSQEFQNFISDPNQTAETTAQNMQTAIEQALELG